MKLWILMFALFSTIALAQTTGQVVVNCKALDHSGKSASVKGKLITGPSPEGDYVLAMGKLTVRTGKTKKSLKLFGVLHKDGSLELAKEGEEVSMILDFQKIEGSHIELKGQSFPTNCVE